MAFPVSDAHCADVGVVEIVGELGIEAAFGERVGHHCCGDVGALVVHTLPRGGVDRSECAVAGLVMCSGKDTTQPARDLYVVLLLVLGNICALVEHCQTHLLPINLDVGAARR